MSDMGRGATEIVTMTDDPLAATDSWPAAHVAVGVVRPDGIVAARGPMKRPFPLASVTKVITALAVLVAVEEETLALDTPAGPPGSTVAHLLAHASGLGPDGDRLGSPGRTRIYSNAGFEVLGGVLADHAGMPFETYVTEAVLHPLGMDATGVSGSPGSGAHATAGDLLALARELLAPTIIGSGTLADATAVAFPGLSGVVPGFGKQDPNDWGLGFEIRNGKSPHWTGRANSPRTFGHFGRSGTFLWVDPDAALACVCLTDLEFEAWAKEAWPRLSDAVLAAFA